MEKTSEITSLAGKTVCVVDAYGLIYQVFHAPGMEMTNAHGEPTGATFGFVRDILAIMTKLPIDYLFCAYDMHAKTFRSEVYPAYKANRSATPDDLLLQFDFTREFLKGVGVPALGVVGFEADDIMATVQRRVMELGGKTILVTSDKDARQLISESTSLYHLRKEAYYTANELKSDWGIAPSQVVDFQALVGDSADNVPGVPLIGPKVAGELLAKHGTLEEVFEIAKTMKGKRFENLRNHQDQALVSRELVRLRQDVPVEFDWNDAKLNGVDPERLRRLFQYWRFRSFEKKIDDLVARFGAAEAEPSEWFDQIEARRSERMSASTEEQSLFNSTNDTTARAAEQLVDDVELDATVALFERLRRPLYGAKTNSEAVTYDEPRDEGALTASSITSLNKLHFPAVAPRNEWRATLVDDAEKLAALVEKLEGKELVAVAAVTLEEPEIGRVRARVATLCGLAIAINADECFYLPMRAPLGSPTLNKDAALDALRHVLESPNVAKVGFELKYDAIVLLNSGVKLRGVAFDTAIGDYLVLAGETKRSLADVAASYLDVKLYDIKGATGVGQKRVSLDRLAPQIVAEYALDAVLAPLNAAPVICARLQETPSLERLALDLETPLVETLAEMEYNGVAIDRDVFSAAATEMVERQTELETEIRGYVKLADPDPAFADKINLNSPKQLRRLLFDDLKLPVVKKTKTGPSVDAEVLEELAMMHPIPEKIVELRKLVKLVGTYLEPLPRQTTPGTTRVSATFNQGSTATGRLSSSEPNLQNIPARSESGKRIRSGFVPDASQGYDAFLSCDYSQIELRVLAHFSGDHELLRAFAEDRDVHASVAAQIFETSLDNVTDDMRRTAKAVNFGLVYGQTSFGLSKSIGISRNAAADYINRFFATYPGVLDFFDRVLDSCARHGYVETLLGRRRALTGVRGPRGRQTLNFPERAAINTVVQGSAADIMKLAMLAVWRRLKREGWVVSRWDAAATVEPTFISSSNANSLHDVAAPATADSDFPLFAVVPTVAAAPTHEASSLFDVSTSPNQTPSNVTPVNRARLLLQIHDELLFETRRDDAAALAKIVEEEMILHNPLRAPLKVDSQIGANWGEL